MMLEQENKYKHSRVHSCSKSPSLAQIAAISIFTLESLVFYIFVMHSYQSQSTKIALTSIFTLTLLFLLFFSTYAGQIDPTDQLVIANKKNQIEIILKYKQSNIGKILFCEHCKTYVKQKSRHCRVCDICIQDFDHHCVWLNTCIGRRNYRMFFLTIILTFANLFVYLLAITILTQDIRSTSVQYSTGGFVISWIIAVIISVFLFLIINLIILHLYLFYKGISTYEFVMLRREQEKLQNLKLQKQNALKLKNQREKQQTLKKENQNIKKWEQLNDVSSKENAVQDMSAIETPHGKDKTKDNIQVEQIETSVKIQRKKGIKQTQEQQDKQKDDINSSYNSQNQKNTTSKLYSQRNHFFIKKQSFEVNQIQSISSMNQTQRQFGQGKANKQQINKFFFRNASVSFLIGRNEFDQPFNDIVKTIQLDQELQRYKNNRSMYLQSKRQLKDCKNVNQKMQLKKLSKQRKRIDGYFQETANSNPTKENIISVQKVSEINQIQIISQESNHTLKSNFGQKRQEFTIE